LNSFQKYWSYFFRLIVEQQSSKYNEQLIVAIQDGKYVLNTKNANYSFASLHRVFRQVFHKIDMINKQFQNILVLGAGAGSIPTIIYKELKLNPIIDAVEIDEKVIDLGKKYFGLNGFNNLNIIIDDATDFVKKIDKKYDLIIVDLFNGIDVPTEFLISHFFEQLKNLLNNKGELLFNFVAYNHETKMRTKMLESEFSKVFLKQITTYRLEGINRVFHCEK
jgi:spermidine synthase